MKSQSSRIWVLLWLLFSIQLSSSHVLGHARRQEGDESPSPTARPTESDTPRSSNGPSSDRLSSTNRPTRPSTTRLDESSSIVITPTPSSTEVPGRLDGGAVNATVPSGQLPLKPEVTPGWGVAGVLLLCTGAVYAIIGIKNDRLHAFFSTAYLAGLGTAVLIIYIMVPPIPLSIQGAYVVAVTLTGAILGVIGMFFKDITEGLGCMLGGFCLSMWLLCLKPGGLLAPDSPGKVILIACFTVFTFCLYFSRFTREYVLIFALSFSGATVTVLGIDCFSRAGLKEFWVYIWNLNDNLFPLGIHTYPVTRGIEVELAAIVILCLAGIISQMRLWKVVKSRRARKEADRAEGQRNLEEEEEVVGRQIESQNARERRLWERTYGNGDAQSTAGSNDSGYAKDVDCEKARDVASSGRKSMAGSAVQVQVIEMGEMAAPDQQPHAVMSRAAQEGTVTVRVAQDDTLPAPTSEGARDPDETMGNSVASGRKSMARGPTSPTPEIIPLPFVVPTEPSGQPGDGDERSSVATYADDEAQAPTKTRQRQSLARRLSQMSLDKLKRMSHRDSRSVRLENESQEELVVSRTRHDPDNGSIAATMDMDSIDGDTRSLAGMSRRSLDLAAERGGPETAQGDETTKDSKHMSTADTVATGILDEQETPKKSDHEGAETTEQPGSDQAEMTKQPGDEVETTKSPGPEEATTKQAKDNEGTVVDVHTGGASLKEEAAGASQVAKSVLSADSVPVSLSQAHLPEALSRVALSYRTNEWAKHLSNAEMPAPDTLQLNEYPAEERTHVEAAVPVHAADLQQTAETGAPAPHLPRTNSVTAQPLTRTNSQLSVAPSQYASPPLGAIATLPSQQPAMSRQASTPGMRRSSKNLHIQAITEEPMAYATIPGSRSSSSAAGSLAGGSHTERAPVPGVVSYNSPQTLIGQRDAYLRQKSNPTLPASMTMPDVYSTQRTPSESGSVYNYPTYGSGPLPTTGDADDLPLSQRKEMMRRHSSVLRGSTSFGSRPPSGAMYAPGATPGAAESGSFDSHQPQRYSTVPSQAARESQLAAFRQSVQSDVRSGTPVMMTGPRHRDSFYAAGFGSSTGLDREAEIQRSIDAQRAMMMGQKEVAAQRMELNKQEKDRHERAFTNMMQSGQWNDAHRDMMRKMQSSADIQEKAAAALSKRPADVKGKKKDKGTQ